MSLQSSDTRHALRWQCAARAKEAAMTHLIRTSAVLVFSLALATSACTDKDRQSDSARYTQPAPTDAPPALMMAHEAYLAGDYAEMGERLKEVIVDPHTGELARENAFALLERAYEATRGQLPARTPLPKDVEVMTLGVLNGANPFGAHRLVFLYMRVLEGRAEHIKDIRVTRLPSEPIIALAEKRGTFSVTHGKKGFDEIKLEARGLDILPDRGAFAIQVVFDDGRPGIDAFVLANKLVASTQPDVTSPTVGQVYSHPHPEITWRPCRSPEYMPWEARSVNVGIVRESTKEDAWTFYKWDPGELAKVRVGDPETPAAKLEPDSYWLSLLCTEERKFGGIWISRLSETGRSFSVVR
jgi:hypothetical protein